MAHVIRHWPLITKVHVQSQASQCAIRGAQMAVRCVFSQYFSFHLAVSFQQCSILPTIPCSWISVILTQGPSFLQPQLNLGTYHLTLHNSLLSSSFMLYFCSFRCCNLTGYFHISPHLEMKNKCVSNGTRQNLVILHSQQDIHDEGKKTVLPLHAMKTFAIVEVVRSTYSSSRH